MVKLGEASSELSLDGLGLIPDGGWGGGPPPVSAIGAGIRELEIGLGATCPEEIRIVRLRAVNGIGSTPDHS